MIPDSAKNGKILAQEFWAGLNDGFDVNQAIIK
jgi:hypothetical protein